jgi:hypothetical protein
VRLYDAARDESRSIVKNVARNPQHTVDEGRDWRHWATPANLQQQQDQHPEWRLFGAVAPELDH